LHEFIPNVLCTTAGSAAGTPLADLIYSLAVSRVFITIRTAIECADLGSFLPFASGAVRVHDVSFVDDMATPVVCKNASELVSKISSLTSIIFVCYKLYGMDLNFLPAKSAAIVDHRGPGKVQAA